MRSSSVSRNRQCLCVGGLLLASVLVSGYLTSAKAATSSIVGFYDISLPAGNSAWVCGLVGPDLYTGVAATVTTDLNGKAVIQFNAPGWTPGSFNLHYAEPQSGIGAGLVLDIISNTADTLTLNTTPAAAGLVNGIVLIVRDHATLKSLLPDGGGVLPFVDTLSLFGSTGLQTTYFYNSISGTWITVLGANASDVIVRPGQGFVMQAQTAKTVTIGKGGTCFVKTTPTKIRAYANVPNIMGALNPLGSTSTTLGTLGIATSMQAFNDSLVTLAPGTLNQTGTYLSTGSALLNSGTGQLSDNTSVSTGAGVVINVNTAKNISVAPVSVTP